MVRMNILSTEKRIAIVKALVDGCSIRATVRMTGAGKNTIARLLASLGEACAGLHDSNVRGLACKRVQCDEIWCFCYAKEKNVPAEFRGQPGYGDIWTWVALDSDTKLIVSWHVGQRTLEDARAFMDDLAGRVTSIADLTTDGFSAYPPAVQEAFGAFVSYAQVIKHYGHDASEPESRYSPAKCTGVTVNCINGNPDKPSTSHVERQNLTMRMSMRRFTRLTNAHSKKAENHVHAVALHAAYYNFCRIHATLRVTPAMAAGLTDHLWSVEELIGLID